MTVKQTSELMEMCRAQAKTGRFVVSAGYSVTVYRDLATLRIMFSTGGYNSNKAVTRRAKRHARKVGLKAASCASDLLIAIHSRKDFNRIDDLMIFLAGKSMQKTARNNAGWF